MPELPEVQTVCDTLSYQIADAMISDVVVLYPKIIEGDIEEFRKGLLNQHFRRFRRRGKYLLFEMDDVTFVSHLRMEGKYFIYETEVPYGKHDHVVFVLSDGRRLVYNDVRKFGRMNLTEKRRQYRKFRDLGPEPFWDSFNADYCRSYLSGRRMPIKEALLDQRFVAGIGNIYADEILFACHIHPKTPCDQLDEKQISDLIRQSRKILKRAIRAGGTTIRSYTSSLGVTGRFQMYLRAHDQKVCPLCGKKIVKIRVGSRGTYFCENCQKEKT